MPAALTESGTPEQNTNFQQAMQELLALGRKYQAVPPVAEAGTPEQNANFAQAMAEAQALAAKHNVDLGKYAARPSQSLEQAQRKAALLAETAALRSQPDPTWLTGYRQANAEVAGDVARGVAQVPVGMLKFAGTMADATRHRLPEASQVGETGVGGSQSALTTLGEFIESQANRLPGGDLEALSTQFNRGIGQLGGMLTPAAIAQTAAKRLATGAALKAGAASEVAVLAGAKAGRNYGAATAVTAGFGQEFDDAFQRSRQLGDDPDTSLFKALGYGTVAAGIEQFAGAGRLFRKFFPSQEEAVKALTTWNVSKEIVKNFLAGYAEEAAQKIAQNVIVQPGSDLLAGAHEEGRVGGLVQGLVGLPGAARGMISRQPPDGGAGSQPPPLPIQTGRVREANEPALVDLPVTTTQPSVAPADLLGRTFPYNEQGAIARIVGATSQGVEIETPEGKAQISYTQWQTTPQDVFERAKTQTELPYSAAISDPPAGTIPSQPAADPITAATPKSSTQLTLPSEIAKPFTDFSKSIPDSDVYHKTDERGREDFGIETEPHITVLYGLTEHDPSPVRRIVQGGKPITVTLGKISVFESPEYDVLKVDVKGRDLVNLNSQVSKLPNEQAFKGYKPHLTLAYLKKGAGKKYAGDAHFVGQKLTFNSVTFSPPSEIRETVGRTEISLSNAPNERTPDEVLIKTDAAAPVAGVPLQTGKPKTARAERLEIKQRMADAKEFQRLMIEYDVQEGWIKRPDLLSVKDQDSSHQPGTALIKAKVLHAADIKSARKSAVSDLGGSVEETTREDVAALLPKLKAYIEAKYGVPAKQRAAFEKATAAGPVATDAERLSVGDTLNIEGEPLKVTARDDESGDITLEDGTRFGVQTLSEGETIYVERVDEQAPPTEAPSAPLPKLRRGEKGTDLERQAAAKSKAQSDAAEAKRIQDDAQGLLSEIAFSQRAAATESGLTVESAQESMRPMLVNFPESSRPQIVVAPARDWPSDTQALIPAGKTVNGATHRRTVSGKTVTTIYIDPEQIGSDEELRQVLAEELVGHSGMAALLSENEIDRLYELLNRSRSERVAELSKDVIADGDTITGRRAIVDEFLGESARTLPRNDPLWRQLLDAIVNALRRLNLLPASLDESKLDAWVRQLGRQANRRLRSGRYNLDDKVILLEIAFSSKPKKIVTVMHGVPQEIGGMKTADFDRLSALEVAKRLIAGTGLVAVEQANTDGILVLIDEGPPSTTQRALRLDKSVQELIEITKQGFFRHKESELRPPSDEDASSNKSQEPNVSVALAQFMDTMAFMALRMRNEYDAGRNAAFSEDRVKELLEYAQGWRSQVGRTLQMMNQQRPRGVLQRGKYMDVELKSAMQEELDPQGIITKVLREIRVRFGKLLGADPITGANPTQADIETLNTLTGFLDATFARTAQRMTSKLYRMVQSALQPQVAKTLTALEAEAAVQEAFRQIIANAKLVGITEQEKKTKPLTALFKLLKFSKPEAVAGIDAAIAAAVRTGERQAGREIFAETASEEDLALYDEGLIQPTSEQVEEGLLLPRHKHWKAIRDNLLGYSPVTDHLVTQVLRGDFKGIRGKPGAPKPTVPKIDLAALAKETDVEVQRVFDEYAKNIRDMLDMTGATPWMQTRIAMQILEQLTKQLAGQRETIRNRFFTPKKERAAADTPSERFQTLVNAGLLTDERILNSLLAEAAKKSAVTKLLPTMKSLIAQVFSTPAFKRDELADRFVGLLVDQFQIEAAQQAEARKLFKTAFERKMKEAKDKALDLVYAALPDNEKDQIPKGRANWKTLTGIVNAGFFDDISVYREIARKNGWRYNEADIAEVKRLAEQAQRLLELSDAEKAAVGGDPAKLARAALDRASNFKGEIKGLEKRMHTLWARLIKPIRSLKPYGPTEKIKGRFDPRRIRLLQEANIRANNVKAYYEHIVGNILFSLNFGVRQTIDIGTSSTIYTPTRAWGQTKERFDLMKARAVREGVTEPMRLEMVGLFREALGEAFSVRFATIGAGWSAMKEAWKGRNLPSQVEGFDQSIKLFDRVNLKIKELHAAGGSVNHAQAIALQIFALEGLSLRFAGSLDVFQSTPKAWQEFRHLITTEMIRLGMSKAERIINEEAIMGDVAGEYKLALAQAEMLFSETGIEAPKSQIKNAAWEIIMGRAYERASGIGLNVDDADGIKARIRELAGYTSWNLPEGGIGGLVMRVPAKSIQEGLEKTIVKLPFIGWLSAPFVQGLGLFGNAMAMSANRGLVALGGGSIPGSISKLQSPGVHYAADRGQRQAESAILLPTGLLIAGAIITGIFKWYGREPDDELERESRRDRGILPGTLGIPVNLTGKELLVPLTVGPGFYVASWANFGGFLRSRMDKRIKEQAALDKEAAERGLKAEQLPSWDYQDLVGAGLLGLSTPFTGGRTASGKFSAFDFQLMMRDPGAALKRLAVSQLTPSVPLLPAYSKLMWAGGVRMDLKRARLDQLLVPLPWSGARQVNRLGDEVSNPNAITHAAATVTGGFGIADEEVNRNRTAYTNFTVGGYHPALNLNEGRNFNGAYRRFTDGEANHFVPTVGARFKANLDSLGDISGMDAGERWKASQGAYHAAERETLQEMGFTPNPVRQAAGGSVRPKSAPVVNRPRSAALPRSGRSSSRAFSVRVPSYAPTKLKRGRRSRSSRRLFASTTRPRRVKLSRVRSRTKSRQRLFSV